MIQNQTTSLSEGFLHETDWQTVEEKTNRSIQFQQMGLELDLSDQNLVRLRMPEILDLHRGGTNVSSVNGAMVSYICDAAIGFTSIRSGLPLRMGSGVGRLEIRMQRPLDGTRAEARAWITAIRRNLIYSKTEILDDQNRVCTRASGVIYMNRRGLHQERAG